MAAPLTLQQQQQQQQQPLTALLLPMALAHLDLWLLQRQVQLLRAAATDASQLRGLTVQLTACMQMLGQAAGKGALLAQEGYDMEAFKSACRVQRQALDKVAATAAMQAARKFELQLGGGACGSGTW